jgi:hypothetical protein
MSSTTFDNCSHSYDDWYYTRPLIAGLTGALGAFIWVVLLRVGTNKGSSALAHFDPKQLDRTLLDIVAFAFGFAEARFRDLLDAVFAVVFSPGNAPKGHD